MILTIAFVFGNYCLVLVETCLPSTRKQKKRKAKSIKIEYSKGAHFGEHFDSVQNVYFLFDSL